MTTDDANTLHEEGRRALPAWNEPIGPERSKKLVRAVELLERAYTLGHFESGRMIAALLEFNDIAAAHAWSVGLAKRYDEESLVRLLGNHALPEKLARETLADAERGEPWAQTAVGRICLNAAGGIAPPATLGLDVAAPRERALDLLSRAASQGWSPAQWILANELRKDEPARALDLAKSACATGTLPASLQPFALDLLAVLLETLQRPLAEVLPVRQMLADSGHAASLTWLGDRYRLGEGVPSSPEHARALYSKAADAGDPAGCRELGKLLEAGVGGAVDDQKARAAYERAAELGADRFARARLVEKWGLTFYAEKKKPKNSRKK